MLPRAYRLSLKNQKKNKRGFLGERFSSPLFSVVVGKKSIVHEKRPVSQFAFVVSNRISKKAVTRNRIKRLLGEAVGQLLAQVKPDYAVAIFAKKDLSKLALEEIRQEFKKIFKKANLLVS